MKVLLYSATLFCLAAVAASAPSIPGNRPKRVSDQRLAELQTLSAMAKSKYPGNLYLPAGLGDMNIHQIGRKRRASLEDMNDYVLRRDISEFPYRSGPSPQFVAPLLIDTFPWASLKEARKDTDLGGIGARRDNIAAMLQEGGNFI